MRIMADPAKKVTVRSVTSEGSTPVDDFVAIEEPLEIQLRFRRGEEVVRKPISITMRTPGNDDELAAGFLFTEGVVRRSDDVVSIEPCGPPNSEGFRNTVRVELRDGSEVDLERLERHFYTSSSCGVCGKTSIEALQSVIPARIATATPVVSRELLESLPSQLRRHQNIFEFTGGLHASALFDADGKLVDVREDVGRHNALDKLIGALFLRNALPLDSSVLLLSGRASFELMQKAAMGGIAVVAAIGAPSSLAIELAENNGMTLVGFLREGRFNVYAGAHRIRG